MSDPPTLSSYLEAIERGMERGRYRETLALIEAALRYYPGNGQVLVWQAVVTEALGDTPAAIALADKLRHHPQVRIRADARRLLGIWQAPQLRRSEAWLTTIPDLNPLDSEPARIPASRPPSPPPPPAPPLQANSGSSYAVIWFLLGVVTVATCIGLGVSS